MLRLANEAPLLYGAVHSPLQQSTEADELGHARQTASSAQSAGGSHGENRRDLNEIAAEATRAVAQLQSVPARGQTGPLLCGARRSRGAHLLARRELDVCGQDH